MRTIRKRAVMETVVTPKPVLYLVIPCYNEQDILAIMGDKFETKLKSMMEVKTELGTSSVNYLIPANILLEFLKVATEDINVQY